MPIFHPGQNSQIKKVLEGEELMKTTLKDKTEIQMQANSKPGAAAENLVFIYDPKCKYCNAFKPEYEKLAELV